MKRCCMLIQFTVENFLSIRDKVYLSLEPSSDKEHVENIVEKGNENAINTLLIYGANASGKSSIFKAITTALNIVRKSNSIQITDKLPIIPFKLDGFSKDKPSSFEFTFVAKDFKKYVYGFSATTEEITEEYLYVFNSAKATQLFDISKEHGLKFNREFKSKFEAAYTMNTSNKLFISTATIWNVECTKAPFEWLAKGIDTFSEVMNLGGYSIEKYRTDEDGKYISFTKRLLQESDINISDISVSSKAVQNDNRILEGLIIQGKVVKPSAGDEFSVEVKTGHTVTNEMGEKEEYSLLLQEESLGTQQLFFYGPVLKDAFDKGKTIVIDEIECSIHPILVKNIINMFRNKEINKNGAQLVCTTHETTILSLNAFRRDQIYFTEKDNGTGVTDLYSLDDFSVRKSENIEKGYLLGRYGAIPFLMTEEVC